MSEGTRVSQEHAWTILDLPLTSLAALGKAPDLACGGLSPSARLAAPEAPADAAGTAVLLNLYGLADQPVLAMTLSASQFWVLAAIFDAYRTALGIRRLSKLTGTPLGVMVPDVIEAWQTGLEARNPGWAVSLFSLLVPDSVPESFEGSLRQTLEEMDDADLLMVLDGDLSAGKGATVVFSEGLELLAAGLSSQLFLHGLTVQRVRAPGEVEVTAMGGWRTPSTLWLVDLSGIEDDEVRLVIANDELMTEMLDELLGGENVPDDSQFCPFCAEEIKPVQAPEPTPPPAATVPMQPQPPTPAPPPPVYQEPAPQPALQYAAPAAAPAKSSGSGAMVAILVVVGLLVLVGGGIGAYVVVKKLGPAPPAQSTADAGGSSATEATSEAATECLNHLKQLALGALMYAQDNGEKLPPDA